MMMKGISMTQQSNMSIIVDTTTCPSCGQHIKRHQGGMINELPGLPAGVKFDPSDQELLEHLESKASSDIQNLHPLIDDFIPTLEAQDGICSTHPHKLPGVRKDGLIRHFFHRPSKAYTTGTRKRRKVINSEETEGEGGRETRWHKTGKTRPVFISGKLKGYKKILVLYANYGKQSKPEKTNWVMHQYHLGSHEEEKEGELVVSKVFYQTQPRQCSSSLLKTQPLHHHHHHHHLHLQVHNNHKNSNNGFLQFYNSAFLSFDQAARAQRSHLPVHDDDEAPFIA